VRAIAAKCDCTVRLIDEMMEGGMTKRATMGTINDVTMCWTIDDVMIGVARVEMERIGGRTRGDMIGRYSMTCETMGDNGMIEGDGTMDGDTMGDDTMGDGTMGDDGTNETIGDVSRATIGLVTSATIGGPI
jgi:hypothetical protein